MGQCLRRKRTYMVGFPNILFLTQRKPFIFTIMDADKKINYILQHFDWDRTLTMMKSVNWKYGLPGNPVEMHDIIDTASGLLERAATRHDHNDLDSFYLATGGFRVNRYNFKNDNDEWDFHLELIFEGAHWGSEYYDAPGSMTPAPPIDL